MLKMIGRKRSSRLFPVVLDLNELIHALRPMACRVVGERTVTRLGLASHAMYVNVAPPQLTYALYQIVLNARDTMPEGGELAIEISDVETERVFSGENDKMKSGCYVRLSIRDTGHGMEANVQARCFEPFFSTKPVGQGTGLGLSSVQGIVMQTGGHIEVSSKPGRGTTLNVFLPIVEAPTESTSEGTISLDALRGSETILVLEEDADARTLICAILEANGYTTLEASTEEEALAITGEYEKPIDVLITQYDRLRGDRSFKIRTRLCGIETIYLSDSSSAELENTLSGNDVVVEKPISPYDLLLTTRRLLDSDVEKRKKV